MTALTGVVPPRAAPPGLTPIAMLIDVVAPDRPAGFAGVADLVAADLSLAGEAETSVAGRPDLDVKTIGELVGYPDQFYFSRVFKNAAGMSPTEFRASNTG